MSCSCCVRFARGDMHMIARASTVLHVDQDPYVVFGVACPVRAW